MMRNFLVVLMFWAVLACRVPAYAHAILVESAPGIGAVVTGGHVALRLRFNSRVDRHRSRLTLIGPDQSISVLPILPEGSDDLLLASVELPAGDYVVRWQVLAVDGHITRGAVPFTVRSPGGTP